MPSPKRLTAFADAKRVASGPPAEVAAALGARLAAGRPSTVLVFDDATGAQTDLDPRTFSTPPNGEPAPSPGAPAVSPGPGTGPGSRRSPGRPKLGVVGHEVTLLPRHWEWLKAQPGGASVALRKLVDRARRDFEGADQVRRSQEATFRFLSAIAGDEPGFEEATRALFARDRESFAAHAASWSPDVRAYAIDLAADAFGDS